MNSWPIVLAVMLIVSGYGGWRLNDLYYSEQRLREAEAVAATIQAAAAAIAKVPPKYVTINKTLEKELRTETRFEECKNTPAVMETLNSALRGGSK